MPFDEAGNFIPEPDSASRPVLIGTIIWLVAGLALVIVSLSQSATRPWVWVCLVGVICGAGGLVYLRWRSYRGRRAYQQSQPPSTTRS